MLSRTFFRSQAVKAGLRLLGFWFNSKKGEADQKLTIT